MTATMAAPVPSSVTQLALIDRVAPAAAWSPSVRVAATMSSAVPVSSSISPRFSCRTALPRARVFNSALRRSKTFVSPVPNSIRRFADPITASIVRLSL